MTAERHDRREEFTILVVCTGNICRSPIAEQLLRARLSEAGVAATVTSAGTSAVVGGTMTSEAAELSARLGGDPAIHQPQQLNDHLVAEADLVLTATREHRSATVLLYPAASRYTYTLKQFARLALSRRAASSPSVASADLGAIPGYLQEIAASRGTTLPPERPDDDDIEDPYRRSAAVYDRVGRAIDVSVTAVVTGLASAAGRS